MDGVRRRVAVEGDVARAAEQPGRLDEERGRALVAIREPAVTARCRGDDLPLGGRVVVRLVEADVMQRLVRFELA